MIRDAVLRDGAFSPRSYADSVACEVPANAANCTCVKRLAYLAVLIKRAGSMTDDI